MDSSERRIPELSCGPSSPTVVDVSANRQERKWTTKELFGRLLWEILRSPLIAWTPRPLWGWRRGVLRLFGAKIGRETHICPSVKIAIPWNLDIGEEVAIGDGAILYSLGSIRIGSRATVSQHAHLCAGTHDFRRRDMRLVKAEIEIGDEAWICADAFVGPGVRVGRLAIVGARAVAVRDVAERSIVIGNPALVVGQRSDPLE
jgi:putative colanic acid biosynthesis acetyltransferase WcaF